MTLADPLVLAQTLLSDIKTEDRILQKQITHLKKACASVKHVTALYVHLYRFTQHRSVPRAIKDKIEAVLLTPLKVTSKIERNEQDAFQNPVLNAEFESQLSVEILKTADISVLLKINDAIIQYLKRHHEDLIKTHGNIIHDELNKYKIPFNPELCSVDALIELLARPVPCDDKIKRIQILSETFTLHLIFFNYQHVYDPSKDLAPDVKSNETNPPAPASQTQAPASASLAHRDPQKIKALQKKREEIHRQVRPKDEDGMFKDEIRGRVRVYSKQRSRHFGICDDSHTPTELKNIHAYDFIPHKYRARPNPDSPLVKHLKTQGVSFISGPSGTAADCIEGLQFLCPALSPQEYQSYLNLLAAAETGQGHHSIHEVILTSVHAGVLPMVKAQDKSKPFWERVDYQTSYHAFLSTQFKNTSAYEQLCLRYPQYLERLTVWQEEKIALHKAAKAFKSWQITTVARTAEKHFKTARFWREHVSSFKYLDKSKRYIHFVSEQNLILIQSELSDLTEREKRFRRLFCAQDISLSHATNKDEKIEKSGRLLSDIGLTKTIGAHPSDSTDGDADALHNNDYVFFRFELKPVHYKSSRFGGNKFVIDGRGSHTLQHTWISLFEMYAPLNITIVDKLYYDNEIVRSYVDYDRGVLAVQYEQDKQTKAIDLGHTIFAGNDLMPGLALCMIRELRRIGGKMQSDFLSLFDAEHIDLDSPSYQDMLVEMNYMLSRLFRVEAKIPRQVYLRDAKYRMLQPSIIKETITNGNLFKLRHCLTKEDINAPLWEINDQPLTAIQYAVITDQIHIVEWLAQQEARLDGFITTASKLSSSKVTLTPKMLALLFNRCHLLHVDDRTEDGCTWLHVAARLGLYDILLPLAQIGVSPLFRDKHGREFVSHLALREILSNKPTILFDIQKIYQLFEVSTDTFHDKLKKVMLKSWIRYTASKQEELLKICCLLFDDKTFLNQLFDKFLKESTDYITLLQFMSLDPHIQEVVLSDDDRLTNMLCRTLLEEPSEAETILTRFTNEVTPIDNLVLRCQTRLARTVNQAHSQKIKVLLSAYPHLFDHKDLKNAALKKLLQWIDTSSEAIIQLLKKGATIHLDKDTSPGKILFETMNQSVALLQPLLNSFHNAGYDKDILMLELKGIIQHQWKSLNLSTVKALIDYHPELISCPRMLNHYLIKVITYSTDLELLITLYEAGAKLPNHKDDSLSEMFIRILKEKDWIKAVNFINFCRDKATIDINCPVSYIYYHDTLSSLSFCAKQKAYDLLDVLLTLPNADPSKKNHHGNTYLTLLAENVIQLLNTDLDKALALLSRYPNIVKENPAAETHLRCDTFMQQFKANMPCDILTDKQLRTMVALDFDLDGTFGEDHETLLIKLIKEKRFDLAFSLLSHVNPASVKTKDKKGGTAGDYLIKAIFSHKPDNLLLTSRPVKALFNIVGKHLSFLPMTLLERLIKDQAIPELLTVISLNKNAYRKRVHYEDFAHFQAGSSSYDDLNDQDLISKLNHSIDQSYFINLLESATKRVLQEGKSTQFIEKVRSIAPLDGWDVGMAQARFETACSLSQTTPLKRLKALPEYPMLLEKVSQEDFDETLKKRFLETFQETKHSWFPICTLM